MEPKYAVLFINKFLDKHTIYREPLGIMSLASAISLRHNVFILEPVRENIFKKIENIQPQIIAYSLRSGYHQYYIDLNKVLKKKYGFISVFGGPHPTFFPEMINEEGVDCVCRGEAEEAFLEFLDLLEDKKDITKVKNFWIKKANQIHKNPCRPLVQDLDKLTFPSRSIFAEYPEIRNAGIRSFIIGRGCPFNCSYCFNAQFKKIYAGENFVRRRSVDNVIKEVEEVKRKYNFEVARFEDDTFNTDIEWLRKFSQEFRKLNLKFICTGIRADLIDEEQVRLLKEANCITISFGIETGSEKVRKEILERSMSDDQIINCARLFRKYRIFYTTENILAIPNSTLEDDLKTLKLNIECKSRYPLASIMQPYPGTKMYDIVRSQGLYQGNLLDNLPDSFYDKSVLKIEDKAERENLQRLFALTVRFPFLYRHIRWLIRLRLDAGYSFLGKVYKVYVGAFEYSPCKRSLKEYLSLIRRYFFLK